ncbi:MAG: hypothetical protein EZS28_025822 [Streblomastix strix]|uniref:Uncharacterized protein n=1 Tax=Streblomastix strix TaxID=222440 RepID=A0A5J4V869_9EUKA|nr:MAG: hypothetical protein EZS28_025822 [Streblomastix strix]
MPKKGKKGRKSRDVSASASEIFNDNIVNQQAITGINDWRADMEAKPYRIFNYQRYRPPQVAKIPDILKSREIIRSDPEINLYEAHIGLLGLMYDAPKRQIQGGKFPYSLQQKLLETGSKSLPITEEQQQNYQMNQGSPRLKQSICRYLNDEFANQEQATDLAQSSQIDVPPEISLAQEKLNEAQQQKIEADSIALLNLNTVYDIGALDWEQTTNQ